MNEPVNLFEQQAANRRRSRWVVAGFIAFFAWLGFGGDYIYYLATLHAPARAYHHVFPWLGFAMTGLALFLVWRAEREGPGEMMWSIDAWELLTPATPQQQELVNVVEEMSIAAGLPRPRIFLLRDPDPNALSTGYNPTNACIAVTDGLLRVCDRDELQGVIAHEMGHIKNGDTELMTVLGCLVGVVAIVADGTGRLLRYGGAGFRTGSGSSGGGGGGKKGGSPVVVILLLVWLLSWLLAPFVVRILALAVSRKREFLADAMAAQFTRNPMALATALEKIEGESGPTEHITKGCAHMCIVDPLGHAVSAQEGRLADALGTHPPTALRVARLKAMAYQDQKKAGTFVPS